MAYFYNSLGGSIVNGTTLLDRFFAFTKDDNFDHARADATIADFAWTSGIKQADGSYYVLTGSNVQISMDVFVSNGATDVLYGSNLNDAIFYNNAGFHDGVGGIDGVQQFYLAKGDDIADFSAHGVGGIDYAKQLLIHGEDGNDTLIGGSNTDNLRGDAGNDTLIGNGGGDIIDGGDGDDIIYGDDTGGNAVGGQDQLYGKDGNDVLYGGAKGDLLDGGTGNDILYGGASGDTLYGGAGDDLLYGDDAGAGYGDKLYGNDGNDRLIGNGGGDIIDGGTGNDVVDGGDGGDQMKGSAGDDRMIGGAGNDIVDGGADTDTAVFTGNRADYRFLVNADGSYQITDTRAGANDGVDTLRNVELIEFADGTLTLAGLNHPPVITSNGGGATAALSLVENSSAVTTVAATDEDSGQTVHFAINGGADAALFTIDAATGVLAFISAPDFENPVDADGNNVYDVVVQAIDDLGGAASQRLAVAVTDLPDGAAPVISSNGGGATAAIAVAENGLAVATIAATDPDGTVPTYRIAGGADAALFALDAATGVLTFRAAPDYEAPADTNHDNVYQVFVEATDGTNADRQVLAISVTNVNDNAPVITSFGGVANAALTVNENVVAAATFAASDADGTAPTFAVSGGADAGRFTIDAATGVMSFVAAPDFEAPADADGNNVYDVVVTASDGVAGVSQALSVTVANINDNAPVIGSNGGGATAALLVAENSTAVTTVVATDADGTVPTYRIAGGDDAALFRIDAATGVLSFGHAPDYEDPEDVGRDNSYQVVVEASDGTYAKAQALTIGVTDVNEIGRTFTGTAGNDTWSPTSGTAFRTTALNDTIYGLAGNDTIDGGAGQDRMEGGAGNDIYYVDTYSDDGRSSNDDLVIEQAGGGADKVNASVSYVLPGEVENLALLGTGDINGTGNELANQILGNAGANILSGMDGNDTILGNDGNDTLYGGNGDDQLVGGNGADSLFGGDGIDKLDGGVGADHMDGGAGNDVYTVDTFSNDGNSANDDTITELPGGGIDQVNASVSFILPAEVDNLTLTGTAAIDGSGNELANTVTGNAAANTLLGLDGNDTLSGLAGDDVLDGGAGSDVLDGGVGNDTLYGGDASDTLKGSDGNDILVGGLGKDTLTGGPGADTFVFSFADTTLNTSADRITDFTSQDVVDLDIVHGPLAASAYAETTIATNSFADALTAAKALVGAATVAAFVAGPTDGWLFWDGNGDHQLDQSVVLSAMTSTDQFSPANII